MLRYCLCTSWDRLADDISPDPAGLPRYESDPDIMSYRYCLLLSWYTHAGDKPSKSTSSIIFGRIELNQSGLGSSLGAGLTDLLLGLFA